MKPRDHSLNSMNFIGLVNRALANDPECTYKVEKSLERSSALPYTSG